MLLSREDAEQFFKIHRALMCFVNRRLGLVPDVATPDDFAELPDQVRWNVRNAFLDEPDLIESFVDENPFHLTDEDLEICRSWRHHVVGEFFIFRQLKKYAVFLATEEPPTAYGVLALSEPFENLLGPHLPTWAEAVLLPFKDKVIYDSHLHTYGVRFGGGFKEMLNDSYRQAQERLGIVTSLPIDELPRKKEKPSAKAKRQKPRDLFLGRWRLTRMSPFGDEPFNEEIDSFIEFDADGLGDFQFDLVSGEIDYRVSTRDGRSFAEFSWAGDDDMNGATGRGWAVLEGDEIHGKILYHMGNDAEFSCRKERPQHSSKRPPRGNKSQPRCQQPGVTM